MGATDGDAKTENGEEHALLDDVPTSALHSTVGGNADDKRPLTTSAATPSSQGSSVGSSLRASLPKMTASSPDLSASEGPLRRVSAALAGALFFDVNKQTTGKNATNRIVRKTLDVAAAALSYFRRATAGVTLPAFRAFFIMVTSAV